MAEDALTKSLKLPNPYERMVLHGLFASFTGKETAMLVEGQHVRMYVPQNLGGILVGPEPVSEYTEVEVAEFVADHEGRGRYRIRGSMRPWNVESWVWVGRIN